MTESPGLAATFPVGSWQDTPPAGLMATEGFVVGPNLYAYVRQNPWTSFDPDGLETKKQLEGMRDNARAKADEAQRKYDEYYKKQHESGTWKGNLGDDTAWELYNDVKFYRKEATKATVRLQRLEASAKAIAVVSKFVDVPGFDVNSLDDNSDLCQAGCDLAQYADCAGMVAGYYGGKAVGAAFGKVLNKVSGLVAASKWGISPAASGQVAPAVMSVNTPLTRSEMESLSRAMSSSLDEKLKTNPVANEIYKIFRARGMSEQEAFQMARKASPGISGMPTEEQVRSLLKQAQSPK